MKKLISLITLVIFLHFGYSQKKSFNDVSIDDLISETQYGSDSPDDMELIWWVPSEYWNVVFAQDPSTSQAETESIIAMLEDYVVIMAIKGKIGVFGGVTYQDRESIESITSVTFKGNVLLGVEEEELSPDLKNFISIIKPMMKNLLGPMGENLHVFLYKNPKGENLLPIDPYSNEEVVFKLGDFEKTVALPLGSLLEKKLCPEGNKTHNGKWNYCPYHGKALVEIPKS